MSRQRPVGEVPVWIPIMLAISLLIQIAFKVGARPDMPGAEDLPPPPRTEMLRVAALGEPATVGRLAMIYLQSFDYHGSNALPYRSLDYGRLIGWLQSIQHIDPLNEYPLFAAARIYAEVPDPERQRMILEFIFTEYQSDPNRRWQWAAQAALVAKHRLKDLPLALKYAGAIERLTTVSNVPLWVNQMSVFILEDMNEFEAARIMLGGLLSSGNVIDEGERRFLESRLKMLEVRSGKESNNRRN